MFDVEPARSRRASIAIRWGVGIYSGQVGNCFWVYHHADVSDEAWSAYLGRAYAFHARLDALAQRGGVITFTWKAVAPNAQRRQQLTELMKASEHSQNVAGHALVTDSRQIQMVLKAVDWFVKKPFPEEFFVDANAAIEWLRKRMTLDRAGLIEAVLREVPARERDPSFGYLRTAVSGSRAR